MSLNYLCKNNPLLLSLTFNCLILSRWLNGNNGSNIICSFTTVSLAAIISIYLLVLLFIHMWIESQFTRSSHALFNYGSGCDSFTLKFSRNRERKTIFLRCTLLAVDSSKNEGDSKSENIVFYIYIYFLFIYFFFFLWNVRSKEVRKRNSL